MGTLSLRLPDSFHHQVRTLAGRDDISINQFITTAVAEKIAALLTGQYLATRAAEGDRAAFDAVLREVHNRPPLAGDGWAPSAPHERAHRERAARLHAWRNALGGDT